MSTKKKRSLGTFGILLIVLLFVFAISWIFNGKPYIGTDDAGKAAEAEGAARSGQDVIWMKCRGSVHGRFPFSRSCAILSLMISYGGGG